MAKLNMKQPGRRRERGMSLVEILVGVLIGLIGIVVIFQVLSVSENRKRTTVQGSDAQSAGAIALYTLQRDVQLGGYGFGAPTRSRSAAWSRRPTRATRRRCRRSRRGPTSRSGCIRSRSCRGRAARPTPSAWYGGTRPRS